MLLKVVASAAVVGSQVAAHVQLDHPELTCQVPEYIPNGRRLIRESLEEDWRVVPYTELVDGRVHVGDWIGYQCDAGADLRFTHNDELANEADCMRQCYVPPEQECLDNEFGTRSSTDNYARLNDVDDGRDIYPIFDPMNCYCRSRQCAQPSIPDSHVFVPPSGSTVDQYINQIYWPTAGFNSVQVRCADGTWSENRGRRAGSREAGSETITCSIDGDGTTRWSSPGGCFQPGCPNPRTNAGGFYAESLSVDSTHRHMDSINLDPSDINSLWQNMESSDMFGGVIDNANLIWADSNTISYSMPNHRLSANGNPQRIYRTNNLDGSMANVRDGTVTRFFCKAGFQPYYNADIIQASDAPDAIMGPRDGNSFECVCNNGQWECMMHCRCEGFCTDNQYNLQ